MKQQSLGGCLKIACNADPLAPYEDGFERGKGIEAQNVPRDPGIATSEHMQTTSCVKGNPPAAYVFLEFRDTFVLSLVRSHRLLDGTDNAQNVRELEGR